jgi:hypothetical protein
MEISGISAATTNSVQQQQVDRSRASESASRISETQVQAQRVQQTQERQQVQEAQRTASQQAEQPKPVVNAQGQKIGSIINTTS